MINLSLEKAAEITGGKLCGVKEGEGRAITSIVSDSRKVVPGALFLCIKGKKADGHDFASKALNAGASACLMERKVRGYRGAYILVDSVKEGAQALAEYIRKSLDLTVVAVTGSVGKTTTKEFIAAVLSKAYKVHKTEGNFNNEWGIPFTIFDIDKSDEAAVIEVGVDNYGQMENYVRMVRPDIAVITNIGESHLENFKTRDGIYKEKSGIFRYMDQNGCVILNGDDDILSRVTSVKGMSPVFFGEDKGNAVRAENIKDHGFDGIEFDIAVRDGGGKMSFHVNLPICGIHMIYAALAAACVGMKMNIPPVLIKAGLESVKCIPGHNDIIKTDKYVIMNDCYNASPRSVLASLESLKSAQGRKVAILGDMLELGDDWDKYHYQVGKKAGEDNIDLIICVGTLSEKTYMGARMSTDNPVEYYKTVKDCMAALPGLLYIGDTILVKASHAMGFEAIVDMLSK